MLGCWQYIPQAARKENCADWFRVAATFLTISTALVTSNIMQSDVWILNMQAGSIISRPLPGLLLRLSMWHSSGSFQILCFKRRKEDVS